MLNRAPNCQYRTPSTISAHFCFFKKVTKQSKFARFECFCIRSCPFYFKKSLQILYNNQNMVKSTSWVSNANTWRCTSSTTLNIILFLIFSSILNFSSMCIVNFRLYRIFFYTTFHLPILNFRLSILHKLTIAGTIA